MRESRQVKNKPFYVALRRHPEGEREVLGLWVAIMKGQILASRLMNNLRNRGVEDILIAVVDASRAFQICHSMPHS